MGLRMGCLLFSQFVSHTDAGFERKTFSAAARTGYMRPFRQGRCNKQAKAILGLLGNVGRIEDVSIPHENLMRVDAAKMRRAN